MAIRWLPNTAPESDIAVIDIQVLNVIHGTQAIGLYSRFGWNHPGPLYFQILAPLYWATGYRHLAVVATVLVINLGSLAALALVLRRARAEPGTLLAAAALVGVALVRLDGLLPSVWNPHVILLPFMLLMTTAAATISGAVGLLPAVVAIASFVAQTHIGAAPVAMTLATVAAVVVIRLALVGTHDPMKIDARRAVGIAIVTGIALWAMPVLDQVLPSGSHNFAAIVRFFNESVPADPRGAARAFEHLIVSPFAPDLALEWAKTWSPSAPPTTRPLAPIQFVLLAAAALIWWRRRQRFELGLTLAAAAAWAVGLVVVRRLPEPVHDYTVLWIIAIGVMSWVPVAAIPLDFLVRAWLKRRSAGLRLVTPLLATAVVTLTTFAGIELIRRRAADERASPRIERLAALVRAHLIERGTEAVLVHVPQEFWGVSTGVVLDLYRAGVTPTVDADWVSMFGESFRPTGRERLAITFALRERHETELRYRSGFRLIGEVDGVFVYVESLPAAPH